MQTPASVEYSRATSVDDAIEQLVKLDGKARILAGGHSLIPMMKLRLANPGHLIDINPLEPELSYIREEEGEIRIGCMTRHKDLLSSDLLSEKFPDIFEEAEWVLADPVVRNRGTLGGSVCQADPAEDLSGVVTALHGLAVVKGPDGERVVDMHEFHMGPYMTAVQNTEMLTEVRFPIASGKHGSSHEKVERRAGDFAITAASAVLWLEGDKIGTAGLACSAVGPTTISMTRAEEMMVGQEPSAELFEEAGKIATEDCDPASDGRGSADYKAHCAGVLSTRALHRAWARARGEYVPRHAHWHGQAYLNLEQAV
ncbi:MAG: xanthine dehydrogenase family protein subunit M [Actinomycetota bacterium]|nr:xanthine dehydrogenase family protein subunit M [Actinomycetota bacterium]